MKQLDLTKKYALAVSGGVDSMVMLHIFAGLSPRPNFFVVTVNHNLRDTAQQDCDFVKNYCKKLKVECKQFSVDVKSYCEAMKVSTETGARTLRYGIFNTLDCDYVCLAHQANDNAETVLMHICRGSGANGAEGIREENGRFLRPILGMTRKDIEDYAKTHGVPFVTDQTNSDIKYSRNFVRHEILPRLETLNQNVVDNITRFAENIAEDNAYLDSLANIADVKFSFKKAEVPFRLLVQPKPIAYRVLNKVFKKLGVWYDVEKSHFDAIINLASTNGGKKLCLPFDLVAINDYNKVTIVQNANSESYDFVLPLEIGTTETPLGEVEISREPLANALKFDWKKVSANAVIRTRKQGDMFCKFGGGTKPLGRYLIDKKIPSRNRDELLLVADGSNVLVVIGVEIADSIKVTENSDTVYIRIK